ncbi:gastrin-releasing peptide isoform X1 [Carcharodon carcharias]|uniref:gastrin-releasing peptide isoform X1 n=1 Tax=Carcharodon carcharias TaxID=13397 RepID=UPI001B7E6B32|nr:gastrin-releasing peptide isoform X1 [Carcharodon carcharias]
MGSEFILWKHRLLFSLIVLSITSSKVHYGLAAPVENQGSLTKMLPRGSHWAVGHLMGKKSIDDGLYGYANSDNMVHPVLSEKAKQPEGDLQWAEIAKNFLSLLEEAKSRKVQQTREHFPIFNKKPWQTTNEDSKGMVDYLLQLMNLKDETPS